MRLITTLFFAFIHISTHAQPWIARDTMTGRDSITLFFIGDVMQHSPQITGAWDSTSQDYNYRHCFEYIQPYWEKADYVFANLETTLSNRHFSGYPQFCAPWQLARDMRQCGVDIFTTNNNHSCDKGAIGIQKTIHYLDSLQIPHTGTFTDSSTWITKTPMYIRHGQFKLALLSYTYGTNGIPVTQGQVVSMIDTFAMNRQIEKARLDTATNIIVVIHWGIEYETTPNAEQKRLSHWLHQRGADIIIGSHPHVVQPLEYITEGNDTTGITVYSLGNFISNQSKRYTNGGIGVQLSLHRERGHTHYRMKYLSNYVYRPLEESLRRYYVIPEPQAAAILGSRDSLLYQQFFRDTDKTIGGVADKLQ